MHSTLTVRTGPPRTLFLRPIRKAVSTSTMTAIVYASVCSRIECIAILFLSASLRSDSSLVSMLARLIARLPKLSHISSFMINQLHWLPLSARIQLKILVLVRKSKLGVAPKYTSGMIFLPFICKSHRPLRSFDRQVLCSASYDNFGSN